MEKRNELRVVSLPHFVYSTSLSRNCQSKGGVVWAYPMVNKRDFYGFL
jgi:hypothetical protein